MFVQKNNLGFNKTLNCDSFIIDLREKSLKNESFDTFNIKMKKLPRFEKLPA